MQTKGPWVIAEGMVIHGRRDDGKEQPIAAVFGIVEYGDSRDKEKAAANRHLLASAPDLLAALEEVLNEYRDGYGLNCIEQVHAALSKAKGKV